MAGRGDLQWQQELFQPSHLAAVAVVLIATADRQTNAWVATLARQQHCLVNVADDPALCDFSMPAIVRRGDLTLAISTAGQSPAFAAWLRKRLERLLDHRLGQVVAHYARLRPFMKQCYPDMRARVKAWDQLLTDDAPPVFRTMDTDSVPWHEPPRCAQVRSLVAVLDQELQRS
jgi:siroheme synthase-like protein